MTYKFRQAYRFGDDWDGELLNVPDSAVFLKYYVINERQQEWYIMVPHAENCGNYSGKGCVQVRVFHLLEYDIVHLSNIKPYGTWPDVGIEEFEKQFSDFFRSCFIYTFTQPQYEFDDIEFLQFVKEEIEEVPKVKIVRDRQLVEASRILMLTDDASVEVSQTTLYNVVYKKPYYSSCKTKVRLCDIETQLYNPMKVDIEVSHDETLYVNAFKEVSNKLF